ncbi:MAG: lysophospholipid acyltransferase family protein [Candidatus Omnitrophica bacterium]|nr:lysophospholipid acyltransferase family protein [Candidatus Omnitrophota bacterium]MDD5430077.1 lysophospholipid acyltransferase family protein [Candidatus Omnitrophota bacterium]
MLYRLSTTLVYFVARLFLGFKVKGANCVPAKGPFILASNHLSNLDPPILAVACPRRICFLAKKELFSNRLFSFYLNSVGAIPLKRGKSDIRAMRKSLSVLKDKPLLVFPQGTRRQDFSDIGPGVGFLCRKAGVPVVAARIRGTDVVLPRGAKKLKRAKIQVDFAQVEEIVREDTYEQIVFKIIEKIKSL